MAKLLNGDFCQIKEAICSLTLMLKKAEQTSQLLLKQQMPAAPLMQLRQHRRLQQALASILCS